MMTINDIRDELTKYNKETRIRVSNGAYIIDNFGSDRGNYYDMYLGFTLNKDKTTINSVDDLLKLLNKAVKIGTMYGYKGGDFDITGDTNVTIGEEGIPGRYIHDIIFRNETVYLVVGEYRFVELWHAEEN